MHKEDRGNKQRLFGKDQKINFSHRREQTQSTKPSGSESRPAGGCSLTLQPQARTSQVHGQQSQQTMPQSLPGLAKPLHLRTHCTKPLLF